MIARFQVEMPEIKRFNRAWGDGGAYEVTAQAYTATVRVVIDEEGLAKVLGKRARLNKSRQAVLLGGLVSVEVIP